MKKFIPASKPLVRGFTPAPKSLVRGFTLIELLIVIAIISILAAVVILTLNPAELLKQARDANRVSDLATLNSALSIYLADVATSTLSPDYTYCMESNTTSTAGSNCAFTGSYTITGSSSRAVNGTGWLSVNFTAISSGAPIGNLPVDPTNSGIYVYRYVASSSLVYEINAKMESAKQTNGTTGLQAIDGGNNTSLYEVGNDAGLDL